MTQKNRLIALIALSVGAILLFFGIVPPIPQDLHYHNFADKRYLLGIPNFCDVISNFAFVIPAITGTRYTLQKWEHPSLFSCTFERWMRLTFFAGVFLVSIGSGYYHLHPDNTTLPWDRLPMAISFMAISTIMISLYISTQRITLLFLLSQLIGTTSVLYWSYTESLGKGDLRLYALVQFLPMIAIPMVVGYQYRKGFVRGKMKFLLLALAWYGIAKITELADDAIFTALHGIVSGHTLKHLAAAIGAWYVHQYGTTTDDITLPKEAPKS